jgi:hypothetical protein
MKNIKQIQRQSPFSVREWHASVLVRVARLLLVFWIMSHKIEYKFMDIVGECQFCRETEAYIDTKSGNKFRRAEFFCSIPGCVNTFEANIVSVLRGLSSTCGCAAQFNAGRSNRKRLGRVYTTWTDCKQRCFNPNNKAYHLYGGRGITMYEPWVDDFTEFRSYVKKMPNYERPGYTLDRIKVNGNYEPGNIRWANWHTQGANRRYTKLNTTGYSGVVRNTTSVNRDSFIAKIGVHGVSIHIGVAPTAREAAILRDRYIMNNGLLEYPIQVLSQNLG